MNGAGEERKIDNKKNRWSHSVDEENVKKVGPPVFRQKKFDEPIVKQWFNNLRADIHENEEAFVVDKSTIRSSTSFERTRRSYSKNKEDDKMWHNSLRNDMHERKNVVGDFDFSFDSDNSKSQSNRVNVKEMIKIKEERRNLEKRISSDWLNSLRTDIHENPHSWVVLPSINNKTKSKEI